jgi:predicted Zn-dependent peptidase
MEAAMNDAGGRLDRELLDKGLAVMASLESDALFAAGTIRADMVTSPGDEQRARNALLVELEKLSKNGLSPEEAAAAGALSAGKKLDALQSQGRRALEYARAVIAQQRASDVDTSTERLSKVTTGDIKRVAAAYLKPASSSSGIVRASRPTQPQPKQD